MQVILDSSFARPGPLYDGAGRKESSGTGLETSALAMRSPRELIILIVYLTGCQEQRSLRSKGRRDLCSQGKN